MSGAGHQPGAVGPVAEPGHRGDAQSTGSEEEGPSGASEPPALTADRKEAGRSRREAGEAAQDDPEGETDQYDLVQGGCDEKTPKFAADSPSEGRGDHESALRAHERQPGSQHSKDLPQDLLQMGAAGTCCAARLSGGSEPGPPCPAGGQPAAEPGKTAGTSPSGKRPAHAQDRDTGRADGHEAEARLRPGEKKMSASNRHWP